MHHHKQGFGVGVARSQVFLGGFGFLRTLEVKFFHFDSGSPSPTASSIASHSEVRNPLTRACWNVRVSFETFMETDISCCAPRFPLIGIFYKIIVSQTSFTLC